MIVLINGTYGVGKSTVAKRIQAQIPNVQIIESDYFYYQMIEENPFLAFCPRLAHPNYFRYNK